MLVLSRKRNEALVIGDQFGDNQIRVTVLKIQGETVRIGVKAPPHITIHRDEVHQRILTEMESQATSQNQDAA